MQGRDSKLGFWVVQGLVVIGFGVAWSRGNVVASPTVASRLSSKSTTPVAVVPRTTPLRVQPLYNDPTVVSDAELAAVLRQVQPRFSEKKTKPNYVEHALRIWSVDAKFGNSAVMSGQQLQDFLTDHGKYLASWGSDIDPLLMEVPGGVSVRWGKQEGGSVHHDHWLACLTEAGVSLQEPVFTPNRNTKTINDVLQQALRDFHVDEREVEWSALGFGLWLPPVKQWRNDEGRDVSFDLIAKRLIRGKGWGVCHGTHRLYSMMVLVRLDDEHHILSADVRADILNHLRRVRDAITESQFPDGHWPSNWAEGKSAVDKPVDDPLYKKVIATGHQLEWLAIAPLELHPPRDQVRKAARWCIDTTVRLKPEQVGEYYTFFSHVGGALSLWRGTHPSEFWSKWEAEHPEEKVPTPTTSAAKDASPKSTPDTH